jgi:mannose-1-phosphate guanylyltransferase/mannose-6-phosphate isomerase
MLVLPADHLIRDVAAFSASVAAARDVADAGRIVLFGVRPDRPATAYGYIEPGEAIPGRPARRVERFVEKPDAMLAADLVAGGWLWNSGIFLMRAATALSEVGRYAPAVVAATRGAVTGGVGDGPALVLARDAFLSAPAISFDHAVMEKTELGAVVEAGFDWSDLGTWESVYEASLPDGDGNVTAGNPVLVETRGSYVSSTHPRVGVVGMNDVVVVATDEAVLVTPRSRAAAVKALVATIAEAPEARLGDFVRHYRPWGHYQTLTLGERHQVKRIVVNPGQRLSLQLHAHRAEHWTVAEGTAEVTVGMTAGALSTTSVATGRSIDIPQGAVHRLANRGDAPLTVIEVQLGEYLGEDDIVRLEDDYGR